jgi:hypothetical protein
MSTITAQPDAIMAAEHADVGSTVRRYTLGPAAIATYGLGGLIRQAADRGRACLRREHGEFHVTDVDTQRHIDGLMIVTVAVQYHLTRVCTQRRDDGRVIVTVMLR